MDDRYLALLSDPRILRAALDTQPVMRRDAQGRDYWDRQPSYALDELVSMADTLDSENRVTAYLADRAMDAGLVRGTPEYLTALSFTPVLGTPQGVEDLRLMGQDVVDQTRAGNYGTAAAEAALTAAMVVPSLLGLGPAAKAAKGAVTDIANSPSVRRGVMDFLTDDFGGLTVPGRGAVDAPDSSVTAYKLFRTDPRRPGELFPLFVNANDAVPTGEWVDATAGALTTDGKVQSKLGPLAYRPGWHAGEFPIATHIGGKSDNALKAPDYRPANQVWAEIEMPADYDWQRVALEAAQRNKRGEIIPRTAHITDQVPYGGFYRYKTNPNMTGDWLISGGMKVNRVLPDDEVRAINEAAGVADLPRLPGAAPDFSIFDFLTRGR